MVTLSILPNLCTEQHNISLTKLCSKFDRTLLEVRPTLLQVWFNFAQTSSPQQNGALFAYLEVICRSFLANSRTIHGRLYFAAQVSMDYLCGRSVERSMFLVTCTVAGPPSHKFLIPNLIVKICDMWYIICTMHTVHTLTPVTTNTNGAAELLTDTSSQHLVACSCKSTQWQLRHWPVIGIRVTSSPLPRPAGEGGHVACWTSTDNKRRLQICDTCSCSRQWNK